jgi:hypothetical protein
MLIEQEQTKGLQLLQSLCQKFHLGRSGLHEEVADLSRDTGIVELAEEIERVRQEEHSAP